MDMNKFWNLIILNIYKPVAHTQQQRINSFHEEPFLIVLIFFFLYFSQIGFLTSFPPLLMAVFVIFGGILMDKLIKMEKISTTVGRKLSVLFGEYCYSFQLEILFSLLQKLHICLMQFELVKM